MPYLVGLVLLASLLVSPVQAAPADYQHCTLGSTCVVGEYFFDDNSLPITVGATCTLNSFDPTGTPHFVNQSLSPTADGWYAHSFSTTGYSEGVYRSTLCCSYAGDNLCIDKSFQVVDQSNLSETDIQNALLNATLSAYTNPGSVGERLNDPELTTQNVQDAVWNADTADYTNPGTFGSFLGTLNNLSAADIWSYSNRTLSGFGSLVSDIWSHSTRTLTSFGSLVTDIWDNTPDEIATQSDITNQTTTLQTDINNQTSTLQNDINSQTNTINNSITNQTTTLQNDISNQTTTIQNSLDQQTTDIETVIDNSQTSNSQEFTDLQNSLNSLNTKVTLQGSDLNTISSQITALSSVNSQELQNLTQLLSQHQSSLQSQSTLVSISNYDSSTLTTLITQAQDYLNQLFANSQQVASRLGLLLASWDSLSQSQIETELSNILIDIGADPSHPDYQQSVAYLLSWFSDHWPNNTSMTSRTSLSQVITNLQKASNQINVSGKTAEAKSMLESTNLTLDQVTTLIGNISSPANDKTLYGLVSLIQGYSAILTDSNRDLDNLIQNWQSYNSSEQLDQLSKIETQVLSVNQIPKVKSLLETQGKDDAQKLFNRALALKAIIELNQKLWSNLYNQPFFTTWLEFNNAHLAFRSAAYNPSLDQSQAFTLSYDLPQEVQETDIIQKTGDITTSFETTKSLLQTAANLNLSPQELVNQEILVTDYWYFSETELENLSNQAQDLVTSLQNTSFATQANTLQTEINSLISDIQTTQSSSLTPLSRIATYRTNLINMDEILKKILELKHLASEQASTNSLSGFVGGIQAVSVWGIILIVIAGFVFLTLYMKKLMREPATNGNGGAINQNVSSASLSPTLGLGLPFIRADDKSTLSLRKGGVEGVASRKSHDKQTRYFHMLFIALTTTALAGMLFGTIQSRTTNSKQVSNVVLPLPKGELEGVDSALEGVDSAHNTRPSPSPIILGTTSDQSLPLPKGEQRPSEAVSVGGSEGVESVISHPSSTIQFFALPPTNSALNVRSLPNMNASVVTKLINPTPLTILEKDGDWTKSTFEHNGETLTGWIYSAFITTNTP